MLKIFVRNIVGSLDNEIFIYQEPGPRQGDVSHHFTIRDGRIHSTRYVREVGAVPDITPAFQADEEFTRDLIQAFVELARDRGYKTPDESHAKGKLEATERHLKDLQDLAFPKRNYSIHQK